MQSVDICAINSFWVERVDANKALSPVALPTIGHWLILCPLDHPISVCGRRLAATHYMYLNATADKSVELKSLSPTTAHLFICAVSPGFVQQMADFLSIPGEFTALLEQVPLSQGDKVSTCLHMLASESDRNEQEELFMDVVGQILQMLRTRHEALQHLADKKASTQVNLVSRLCKARQHIEAQFLSVLSIQEIAEIAAISEYHFARLFKSVFGITVHQYISQLRLNYAREQFEYTDLRVTDVALAVGYSSMSAFIRAFRKAFGVTPSTYIAYFQSVKN